MAEVIAFCNRSAPWAPLLREKRLAQAQTGEIRKGAGGT